MLFGELERLTTKQLRCILYDCKDLKYIPHKCLLPTGIYKMKKFDLIELIMTLEYFIPTHIIVRNKYDKVNKQLLINYLDTRVDDGRNRLNNKTREDLDTMLEQIGDSSYNVLRYAIDTDLKERSVKGSILPYVDVKEIFINHQRRDIVMNSLVVRQIRLDNYWFTLRNPWRPY